MKKILMIEDNEDLRFIISQFLSLENFQVLLAENGAIGMALAKDHQPDLILCDINMPVLNGYDVLTMLRGNLSTAKIPCIFLTSEIDFYSCCRAFELGANGYLVKPVDFSELLQAIQSQLNQVTA